MKKNKQKYWYKKEIYACVICGKETVYKERVYEKPEFHTVWKNDACWGHF